MEIERLSSEEIKASITGKLARNYGCEISDATKEQIYDVLAQTVRDEVMKRRTASRGERKRQGCKKLYYLSAEFLVGRALHNNMVSLVNEENYAVALKELGLDPSAIFEEEPEPGLGNGGLGRLAACFLDSLSALKLPAMGCTIRYEYGLFRQKIENGYQVELPDDWLERGSMWEVCRPDQAQEVRFGGHVESYMENGELRFRHTDYSSVQAVPYDIPTLGYGSNMVNMLRCWSAKSVKRLDMPSFNRGDYVRATEEKELAEVISKVLYPEDTHYEGKELRLKQQYFLSSASVQYAVKDFVKTYGPRWDIFADKVALHVNDTHPGMAIPELMRVLMDDHGLSWETAEDITRRSFGYTNHTVMAEALEKWSEELVRGLLPRIYQIIKEIDNRLRSYIWETTHDADYVERTAVISGGVVKMANLCVAACHSVNGVSALHSQILKDSVFNDYYRITPEKFTNVTNGIAHRRWLCQANPGLTKLITETIGDGFILDGAELSKLKAYADDKAFLEKLSDIKHCNKEKFAKYIFETTGEKLDPDSLFDVQVKRLHEYKRQELNALAILSKFIEIKNDPNGNYVPQTYIFGAKAAPGYFMAKKIISFICALAKTVNSDPAVNKFMKVIFVENYSVTAAERLMPAADISEQISLAGTEASGTGNMKLMINGAVTLGTMDGANIEIFQNVGSDNIIIFGMTADEVANLKKSGYNPGNYYQNNAVLKQTIDYLNSNRWDGKSFPEIGETIKHHDPYMCLADFADYIMAKKKASELFTDREAFAKMSLMNVAGAGFFAADRAINEYAENIWHTKSV